MNAQIITTKQLEAWEDYQIGKPCPDHPDKLIKKGKWGNYCGGRTELGNWCSGGWPTDEFLNNYQQHNA